MFSEVPGLKIDGVPGGVKQHGVPIEVLHYPRMGSVGRGEPYNSGNRLSRLNAFLLVGPCRQLRRFATCFSSKVEYFSRAIS